MIDLGDRFTYQEWRDRASQDYEEMEKHHKNNLTPEILESSYLDRSADFQYDKRDRFCVIIPFARVMVEIYNFLTDRMANEFELYYEEYYEGDFKDLFTEEEHSLVKEDLEWLNDRI